MNKIDLSNRIILTGKKLPFYFDEHFQPRVELEFNYLILKEPMSDDAKIFLTEIWQPWNKCMTETEALVKYMDEKNYSEVRVNGNGKVRFNNKTKTIKYSDYFSELGDVTTEEVLEISGLLWPEYATNSDFGWKCGSTKLWTRDEFMCSGGFY